MRAPSACSRPSTSRVANPIAPNQSLLRMSLLPELRGNVLENSKHFDAFRLFEIGREIHKQHARLAARDPAPGGGDL